MTIINGVEHRVVSEGCCDWLAAQVEKKLKDTAWYTSGKKAVKWLRKNPLACEYNTDGTFLVKIPSQSEPGREYVATSHECDCTGNRRHGHCYHRMVARLMERVDTYELAEARHHAELAKRVVKIVPTVKGVVWMAAYDGNFVGIAPTKEEAEERLEKWLAQREWVANALHAQEVKEAQEAA